MTAGSACVGAGVGPRDIDEVWGMDALPSERTVDNFILRLRRLIEDNPEAPRRVLTVRGRGYRFEP